MALADNSTEPFLWLTCTNRGASEVCEAALELAGITRSELESGFFCDPTTESKLRIVAKPGVYIRLARNLDKKRGFVNGAIAVIVYSLDGNAVFVARLVGSGNLVLVHPIREQGATFLPCCYGYATTIRRAQGADMFHGCVYMDQLKRVASRGYAYVACSRFKSRSGCYLYGKARVSDFLPVGELQEEEITERGYLSVDSDDSEGPGLERALAHRFVDDEQEFDPDSFGSLDFMMHDFSVSAS